SRTTIPSWPQGRPMRFGRWTRNSPASLRENSDRARIHCINRVATRIIGNVSTTSLRIPRAVPAGLAIAVVSVGVLIGFIAPPAARWLDDALERSPLPSPGIAGIIGNLPLTWSLPIFGVLGLAAGAALAFITVRESLALTVADDHAEYLQEGRKGWI